MLMQQLAEGRSEVENQYSRVVPWDGNVVALRAIGETMELRPYFEWRGLGFISHSALQVREEYARFDAERLFSVPGVRVADPKACQCGEVLKGVLKPWECKVFGTACTPETPIGTCMVSPEGACAAYYNYGRFTRQRVKEASTVVTAGTEDPPGSDASRRAGSSRSAGRRATAPQRTRRARAPGHAAAVPGTCASNWCWSASTGPGGPGRGSRKSASRMAHGAGGKATQTLIEAIFLDAFRNPLLEPLEDAARLHVDGARLAFTTDSYVVSPLFFPGGDIGDLAVNGTVNDLADGRGRSAVPVGRLHPRGGLPGRRPDAGSSPRCRPRRERGRRADRHRRHQGGGAGQGRRLLHQHRRHRRDRARPEPRRRRSARPGDAILVSGPIGDHGVTIMLARGELDIEADIGSDTAPLNDLVAGLLARSPGRPRAARRDPGRRGHHPERDRDARPASAWW